MTDIVLNYCGGVEYTERSNSGAFYTKYYGKKVALKAWEAEMFTGLWDKAYGITVRGDWEGASKLDFTYKDRVLVDPMPQPETKSDMKAIDDFIDYVKLKNDNVQLELNVPMDVKLALR